MRLFIFLILGTLLMGCFARDPELTGKEGQPIPDFQILFPDSITYYSTSTIKGDSPTVFVYFWTNCAFSQAEINDIQDDIDNMSDIQFYLITPNSLKDLKRFIDQHHLYGYENLRVGIDTAQFINKHFNTTGVPFTTIYGKDHRLKAAYTGQISPIEIKAYAKK